MRTAVLGLALAFTLLLGVLTISAVINGGVDILTAFSLLVIAMFLLGIVGALRNPPPEE